MQGAPHSREQNIFVDLQVSGQAVGHSTKVPLAVQSVSVEDTPRRQKSKQRNSPIFVSMIIILLTELYCLKNFSLFIEKSMDFILA